MLAVYFTERNLGDTILEGKTPAVGDIFARLLRLNQVKFRYVVLLGKPTEGEVLNTWMAQVTFTDDTAMGRFKSYQTIKKLITMKEGCTPMALRDELARQANLTEVGQVWWKKVTQLLGQDRSMKAAMGKPWELT